MYKKPEAKIIEVSEKDIIQTSPTIEIGGEGSNKNPVEWWSLTPNDVKSDSLFRN